MPRQRHYGYPPPSLTHTIIFIRGATRCNASTSTVSTSTYFNYFVNDIRWFHPSCEPAYPGGYPIFISHLKETERNWIFTVMQGSCKLLLKQVICTTHFKNGGFSGWVVFSKIPDFHGQFQRFSPKGGRWHTPTHPLPSALPGDAPASLT
jgi:hypothetical protein